MAANVPEKFHPPMRFGFPKCVFGSAKKEERSFRADWCLRYPWLHYDATNDSAFYHVCLKADQEGKSLSSTKRDPAFVSKGYTYWKDATSAHQQSHCHREAIEVVIVLPKVNTDVGELLSREHHEEKEKNKKMLRFLKVSGFLHDKDYLSET